MNLPGRPVKQVYVLRTDEQHSIDDIMGGQREFRIQELLEGHEQPDEPEISVSITLDEVMAKLVKIEREISRIQRIQRNLSRTRHTTQKVVIIKELSHDEAKKIVEEYLRVHGKADTEELMDLGIELKLLIGILDELKVQGRIKAIEDASTT
jgi:hypothetical protein